MRIGRKNARLRLSAASSCWLVVLLCGSSDADRRVAVCSAFSAGTRCTGAELGRARRGTAGECAGFCEGFEECGCCQVTGDGVCSAHAGGQPSDGEEEDAAAGCGVTTVWYEAACRLNICEVVVPAVREYYAVEVDGGGETALVEVGGEVLQTNQGVPGGEGGWVRISGGPSTSNLPLASRAVFVISSGSSLTAARVAASSSPAPLPQPPAGWWALPVGLLLPYTPCIGACHVSLRLSAPSLGPITVRLNGELVAVRSRVNDSLYEAHHTGAPNATGGFYIEVSGADVPVWAKVSDYSLRLATGGCASEEEPTSDCGLVGAVGLSESAAVLRGGRCTVEGRVVCITPAPVLGRASYRDALPPGTSVRVAYLPASGSVDPSLTSFYGSDAVVASSSPSAVEVLVKSTPLTWPLADILATRQYHRVTRGATCLSLLPEVCTEALQVLSDSTAAPCNANGDGVCDAPRCICGTAAGRRRCPSGDLSSLTPVNECNPATGAPCVFGTCVDTDLHCSGSFVCTCNTAPLRQCLGCTDPCEPGVCTDDPAGLLSALGYECSTSLCMVDLSTLQGSSRSGFLPGAVGMKLCPESCRGRVLCDSLPTPMPTGASPPETPGTGTAFRAKNNTSNTGTLLLHPFTLVEVLLEVWWDAPLVLTHATLSGGSWNQVWEVPPGRPPARALWFVVATGSVYSRNVPYTAVRVSVGASRVSGGADTLFRFRRVGEFQGDVWEMCSDTNDTRVLVNPGAWREAVTHPDAYSSCWSSVPESPAAAGFAAEAFIDSPFPVSITTAYGSHTSPQVVWPPHAGWVSIFDGYLGAGAALPFSFNVSSPWGSQLCAAPKWRYRYSKPPPAALAPCTPRQSVLWAVSPVMQGVQCDLYLPPCNPVANDCLLVIDFYAFDKVSTVGAVILLNEERRVVRAEPRQEDYPSSTWQTLVSQEPLASPGLHRVIKVLPTARGVSHAAGFSCRARAAFPKRRVNGLLQLEWTRAPGDNVCFALFSPGGWRGAGSVDPEIASQLLDILIPQFVVLRCDSRHHFVTVSVSLAEKDVDAVMWYFSETFVTHLWRSPLTLLVFDISGRPVLVQEAPSRSGVSVWMILVGAFVGISAVTGCSTAYFVKRKRVHEGRGASSSSESPQPRPVPPLASGARVPTVSEPPAPASLLPGEVCRPDNEEVLVMDPSLSSPDCCICLINPKSTVLMPCRHLCLCGPCAEKVQYCPLCRVEVEQRMNVWM